jgi:hypothetical protein
VSEDLSPGVFLFRSHPLFKKQDGMDAVRRIIMAYMQRNPAGYFRGISHVAGVTAATCRAGRTSSS